jgi:hypothetical protein
MPKASSEHLGERRRQLVVHEAAEMIGSPA